MGDRTAVQVFVYACPDEQRAAVLAVIEERGSWDEHDSGEGRWIAYEMSVGSADEIAGELREHAPGASFVLWEDPAYQWLGSLEAYTPELGAYSGECDSDGTVVMRYHDVAGKIGDDLGRLYGRPWIEDWQRSGEPAPITRGCDACGAEAGEECRPMCIGQAAHEDALGIDVTEESTR